MLERDRAVIGKTLKPGVFLQSAHIFIILLYSLATVSKQANVRAIMLDLKNQAKVCELYRDKAQIQEERARAYACDMFSEPFPSYDHSTYGYQAIFMSNILHDWSEKTCSFLLKKSFDALPTNGYILISEALFNDDRNGPLWAAYMSFHMFVYADGKQFTFGELKALLNDAGFVDVSHEPLHGNFSLIYARKP
jgi:hypothetical protein